MTAHFKPPSVPAALRPLSLTETVRHARRNALTIVPRLAYLQPIVSGRMLSRWHMVMEPGALKRILLDKVDAYPKAPIMKRMLTPAVGQSLFTTEGAEWRWRRRAAAPVFAHRNVVALTPFMSATADRASDRIAEAGGRVDAVDLMMGATFDVIADVALSGRESFDQKRYLDMVTLYFESIGKVSLLDFVDAPDWVPRPGILGGRRSVRVMHGMIEAAMARRLARGGKADDLLSRMLEAEDPETGRRMSHEEVRNNMQFFIVAGHETTALTIAWALYLLANDEEVQTRAREEAQGVLGAGAEARPATGEDLDALPYLRQVIDETMRLYPPVGMVNRVALEADELVGRKVRAGDTIFLPFYALHRHEMWWEAPELFDPGNFAPGKVKARDRFLHLPFGGGPRVCLGANFAVMQAEIILATLLARWRVRPMGSYRPEPVMVMTLRPKDGMPLAFDEM